MIDDYHIVRFDEWCKDCAYFEDTLENADKCFECLSSPVRTNSRQPIIFKDKDDSLRGKHNVK